MKPILAITLILVTVGLVMIYSTSAIFAEDKFDDQYYFFKRQLIWAGLGIIVMAITSLVPLELAQKFSKPILLLTGFILVLVLLPGIGTEVGGARRWLRSGRWSFQPAEMAKLALIIYSAHFLSRASENRLLHPVGNRQFLSGIGRSGKEEFLSDFRQRVLPLLIVLAIILTLILMQPDLGTAVLIGVIILTVMFLSGVELRYLMMLGAGSLPVLALLILKVGYRWQRILVFLNPWGDAGGSGYQITQSFIALGSGGIAGRGLGQSLQKLYYLPESFTDFIFSIIGEEIGFMGTCGILMLFVAFVCHGVRISKNAPDFFSYLLGMGITVMIGLQAAIHMGVVTGCLPTKGIPLPFVSCGGSSLVVNMAAVGLLMNISRKKRGK